jgi:hypothetical protein
MINKPEDFLNKNTVPKKEDNYSFTIIDVLPELNGLPWNTTTMKYVLSLNPSQIRVVDNNQGVSEDVKMNRITVMTNKQLISKIIMEVKIPTEDKEFGQDIMDDLYKLKKLHS